MTGAVRVKVTPVGPWPFVRVETYETWSMPTGEVHRRRRFVHLGVRMTRQASDRRVSTLVEPTPSHVERVTW